MIHGGDIYRNEVNLDFSININPLGIPKQVKEAMREAIEHCNQYPDRETKMLKGAIESMTGVDREHILCGNGASELLIAAIHGIKPKKAVIPAPSFGGYEYALSGERCENIPILMKAEEGFCLPKDMQRYLDSSIDLLILANPNNPTGTVIERERLKELLAVCLEREIVVLLDECFIEFTGKEDAYSLKEEIVTYQNLIIIRAFTKLFAIPGVRLGYLFCGNKELLCKIESRLPEWNVSIPAQAAGAAACTEEEYLKQTIRLVNTEREFLAQQLQQEGIKVYSSAANYLLIHTKLPLYGELLKKKILIRDCSDFRGLESGYYRIAVKQHEENKELIKEIQRLKKRVNKDE